MRPVVYRPGARPGRQRLNVPGARGAVGRALPTGTAATVVTTDAMCDLPRAVAARGLVGPVPLARDHARYQRSDGVKGRAKELGIEPLFLPSYSPSLNPIERRWRFTRRTAVYGKGRPTSAEFRVAVQGVWGGVPTAHADGVASLTALGFQEFEDVPLLAA